MNMNLDPDTDFADFRDFISYVITLALRRLPDEVEHAVSLVQALPETQNCRPTAIAQVLSAMVKANGMEATVRRLSGDESATELMRAYRSKPVGPWHDPTPDMAAQALAAAFQAYQFMQEIGFHRLRDSDSKTRHNPSNN